MPAPVSAEQVSARGVHPDPDAGKKCNALCASARARSAAGTFAPSALFTSTRSASSITPRLIPCSSSPAPASVISRKKSTISCTAVSDCPTPIVSTRMFRYPAASHSSIASRVRCATPPAIPRDGDGRINAISLAPASSCASCRPECFRPRAGCSGRSPARQPSASSLRSGIGPAPQSGCSCPRRARP